jgi:hypothetical protein
MVTIDASSLDDMAYNFHYHGDSTIGLEDLEKRGWATKEHIFAIMQQVGNYIAMWEDTLEDMENLRIQLKEKEMRE